MPKESRGNLADIFSQVGQIQERIASSIRPILESYSTLGERFAEHQKEIAEVIDRSPDDTRQAQAYLAKRSWFVSLGLVPLSKIGWIARLSEAGKHDEVEDFIQDYVREIIPRVKETVSRLFPDRTSILMQAFEAHDADRFAVSIPTMLAQADGIFFEILDRLFYGNEESELEKTRRQILEKLREVGKEANSSSFAYLMVSQLHEESFLHRPFSEIANWREGGLKDEPMNRHLILHGLATDYDTEPNSLRAIALLDLLCNTKEIITGAEA